MAETLVAITRPPTEALTRCVLTHLERRPIDIALARAQHAVYEETLASLGAEVVSLAPEPDLPDAVFVEDVAVVVHEVAVMTNPGARSRHAEVPTVAAALAEYRMLASIHDPGTLDGGDVLQIGRTVYVGRSDRSNAEGIRQLREILTPHGYTVRHVPVSGCLHLKSACSHLGNRLVLANRTWFDAERLEDVTLLDVPASEPRAANTVRIGTSLMIAGGFSETCDLLERNHFDVHAVDLTELQKAEAGGSCMSILVAH